MANKIFKKNFSSDFAGIDGEMSAIEPDRNDVNRAVNLEYAVGNSLRGRVGCQVASDSNYGFYGLFTHSYTRTQNEYKLKYNAASGVYPGQTPTISTTATAADGASVNKLVVLGHGAYVLDTMDIVVTRVSGTYPFTWYTTANSGSIFFLIKANGTAIVNANIGTGIGTGTTIYDLLGTIDATAELSVNRASRSVCPPFAIVNGNQTSSYVADTAYGEIYRFTVDAGHTFYPGDIINFKTTSSTRKLQSGFVIAVGATTIDYVGEQESVLDNQVLGYMGQNAANFPIDVAQSVASGNLTISFPYLRWIPDSDASGSIEYSNSFYHGFTSWVVKGQDAFYAPPTATSASGNLYVARSDEPAQASEDTYTGHLVRIDGVSVTRAGLPKPQDDGLGIVPITITTPGAGALTGTYKYKVFYRRVDAQGNIIESEPSAATSVTYAANYGGITLGNPIPYTFFRGYCVRSCYKYTAETPGAGQFFYVDDNTAAPGRHAFIQPGDPLVFLDNVAQKTGLWKVAFGVDVLGTVRRAYCTGYDGSTSPSSISMSYDSSVTIPNNQEISAGLTAVVLRTAAGGNIYYVLAELPVTGYGNVSFFDNVTDAVLTAGEQFIDAPTGKEHNPPPACSLVAQHQGGLVVARGMLTPNTVTASTAEGLEYFPIASNSFDIPSTVSGYITAIASDTNDRLAVFKDKAYYDVVGDIDGGAFSVNVKNEGDYGVASQASIARVPEGLIGLSKLGFVVVNDGILDPYRFSALNTRLINQDYYFNAAVAVNDYVNRNYVCAIPNLIATGGLFPTTAVSFVIDYSRKAEIGAYGRPAGAIKTFERSYAANMDQCGGITLVDDQMYHLAGLSTSSTSAPPTNIFRRLRRFDGDSPAGGDGDSFVDNTVAISYILESQVLNFGEPGLLKSPIRLRLWSVPNDYIKEGWVPFSVLVETGASPIAAYIGGSNPLATSSTVTFAADTDVFKDVKLTAARCHFYIVRFTTNTINTAPFLTGYEIMFAANYDKEDFVR